MSVIDDYKQLRMIENIKKFKEMEIAYKANLKLCKYQAQQINKLATCIEDIKEIIHFNKTNRLSGGACISIEQILQKISEALDE